MFESTFKARKVPADAIADMALENFVEMRDKVGDARFILAKRVEALLADKFPDTFRYVRLNESVHDSVLFTPVESNFLFF